LVHLTTPRSTFIRDDDDLKAFLVRLQNRRTQKSILLQSSWADVTTTDSLARVQIAVNKTEP